MRVLHLNVYFTLPEDFDGSVAEAMRLMARYHATRRKKRAKSRTPCEDVFAAWWEAQVEGARLVGNIGMHRLTKRNTWKPLRGR